MAIPIAQQSPAGSWVGEASSATLLKKAAYQTAWHAVAMTCMNVIALPFVAEGMMKTLVISSIAALALGTLFRLGEVFFTLLLNSDSLTSKGKKAIKVGQTLTQIGGTLDLLLADMLTLRTLWHESGHALAAQLFYQNPQPKITLELFNGGVTKFYTTQLTSLGQKLGEKTVRLVISAAGPLFGLGRAISQITGAHLIKKGYPKLALSLTVLAIGSIVQHTFYALSAFSAVKASHDFGYLFTQGGIHPLASVGVLLAAPLLIKGALLLNDLFYKKVIDPKGHFS